MAKLILTDADTYNGISEQITEAHIEVKVYENQNEVRGILEENLENINEVHLYQEGTRLGLEHLLGLNFENSYPNRVIAGYGDVKFILTTQCNKVNPARPENWESGKCRLKLRVVKINK